MQRLSIQKYLNKKIKSYNLTIIALLFILLFFCILLSISAGSSKIPLSNVISTLFSGNSASKEFQIINHVRIPRTLAAILAGCALSLSGLILQSVLNNSIASPSIIGVNSGAGLFVTLITALFPAYFELTPIAAFVGALAASLLVYTIAIKTGASRMTIVLSGTAVSSILGATIDTVLILFPDTAISRTAFLIGGLSGVTIDQLKLPGTIIFFAFILTIMFSYHMNILSLGDETAKSLGLNVSKYRLVFFILSSLLAGSAISFAGLLGFIGLIVPHIARLIVENDNRILVPVCALLGGFFTLSCDIIARVLFAPYEIPVGIIMSFLGGPFFIYLLLKQRKRGTNYD